MNEKQTNPKVNVNLPNDWLEYLEAEFHKDYMIQLKKFLVDGISKKKIIYPHGKDIFNAFNLTPLSGVKVVIIGQDPYHGPGQAHGLSFSVPPGIKTPPSLANIYKEQARDLKLPIPKHGHLVTWAKQGVLLLNAVLTVQAAQAASHRGKGWELFTDAVVKVLNEQTSGVVFLLWGGYAQKKGAQIDQNKHLVLKAPHPSPLSAHRGFLGCGHFSIANNYLISQGKTPIEWSIPESATMQ